MGSYQRQAMGEGGTVVGGGGGVDFSGEGVSYGWELINADEGGPVGRGKHRSIAGGGSVAVGGRRGW